MPKNPIDLNHVAERFRTRIRYKKYRMWMSVPHINNTAMVLDETVFRGGQRLMQSPPRFPSQVNEEYAADAVSHNACSLGRITESGHFIPWSELVGKYPPGYFTHRIGEDVDCR